MSDSEETFQVPVLTVGDDLNLKIENVTENYYKLEDGSLVSTVDRFCKDVPAVAIEIPFDEQIFDDSGLPIPQVIKEHFQFEGRLSEAQIHRILTMGTELLHSEPNLLILDAPVIICGDIHGQYYDLLKLFQVAGSEPPAERYLFLGDYVDRGYFSLECYIYLLVLKICYPDKVYMLRGNHECRHLTKHFTFQLECIYKYGELVYSACMTSFDSLPLAALVNDQFFCVHGGISPQLKKPEDVNSFNRFQELPKNGIMCDLLWSDPSVDYGSETGKDLFVANGTRGCSYRYTFKGVSEFLKRNNLLSVIRGHEAQDAGYRLYQASPDSGFPTLVTLFSAANYVDVYNNKGAILKYDGALMNIRQYSAAPHPFHLPKFMNAFDWSLPFMGEKIASLLAALLHVPTLNSRIQGLTAEEQARILKEEQEEAEKETERLREEELNRLKSKPSATTPKLNDTAELLDQTIMSSKEEAAILNVIEEKIEAIETIEEICLEARENREMITELNNEIGANIPDPAHADHLLLAEVELIQDIHSFKDAFKCDVANEQLPPVGQGRTSSVAPLESTTCDDESSSKSKLDILDRVSSPPPQQQSQMSNRKFEK